jgi:hypothetical protein
MFFLHLSWGLKKSSISAIGWVARDPTTCHPGCGFCICSLARPPNCWCNPHPFQSAIRQSSLHSKHSVFFLFTTAVIRNRKFAWSFCGSNTGGVWFYFRSRLYFHTFVLPEQFSVRLQLVLRVLVSLFKIFYGVRFESLRPVLTTNKTARSSAGLLSLALSILQHIAAKILKVA